MDKCITDQTILYNAPCAIHQPLHLRYPYIKRKSESSIICAEDIRTSICEVGPNSVSNLHN